jgi:DNA-binding NarL/FixJ family response regulator
VKKPMNVLMVDDSAQVIERLKEMLGLLPGVEVVGWVADLPEALETVQTAKPDVVLLDLHLPSGSGLQLLETIKSQKLNSVVIVLTNYAFPQYRRKCVEAGAYAFLDKSTDFTKVPEVVAALLKPTDRASGPPPAPSLTSRLEHPVKVGSR